MLYSNKNKLNYHYLNILILFALFDLHGVLRREFNVTVRIIHCLYKT